MQIRKLFSFLLQTVIGGLAAAFLYVLLVDPNLLKQDTNTVVEVRETSSQPALPATDTETRQEPVGPVGPVSYADAVARAAPAVVNVHTSKIITRQIHPLLNDPIFKQFFGERFRNSRKEIESSLGSGVLISEQGYILTNNHVIAGAVEIQVLLADGRKANASIVGTDVDTDLAVLHIDAKALPSVVIGDSESLRVGDVSLAIGNPFGVGQTVTMGIVSATGRNQLGITAYDDFIQTDAAINPGNSGGALINAHGELVGINSAIYSRSGGSQGIGFAIPISLAKGVMTQIIEQGYVVRGWLGIEAQDLTPQLAESFNMPTAEGVLISGVLRNGPADNAGMLPGDVVISINNDSVTDAREAMKIISLQQPDTAITLNVIRNGKQLTLKPLISKRPQQTLPLD